MVKLKHFYNTSDLNKKEFSFLVDLALKMKKGKAGKQLNGKTLAMLFFNPSLRTRVSFTVAMYKLGGLAVDIPVKEGSYTFEFVDGAEMNKETIEHVKEAAQVLSRYCDAIAIRASQLVTSNKESVNVGCWEEIKKDEIVSSFMKYAIVPVINMESNVYHPCQGLGDAVTIVEKLGNKDTLQNKKYVLSWVPHPKALPMATPNSQMIAACQLGMNVVVVHPQGWELDGNITKEAQRIARKSDGSLFFSYDQKEVFTDADVICAKSWGAVKYYGNWAEEKKIREGLKNWMVDQEKMMLTNNAYFMHCLPVRRNVEVTDEVIDGKNSIVIDQAENRLWAQMAILLHLMQK